MEESEIRAIAKSIVDKAKATARVDQGTLKRSIAYTYQRGKVTFRQIYYGEYGDNSQLEELARKYMPKGVEYNIVLTKFGGGTFEVGKTKQGRATKNSLSNLVRNTTSNIKRLIAKAINKRKDGEA